MKIDKEINSIRNFLLTNLEKEFSAKELSSHLNIDLTKIHRVLNFMIDQNLIHIIISKKIHPKKFPTKLYSIKTI